jgi:DNA adenine methylase
MARPFIKWVGGKAQLLGDLLPLFPRKIRTYYEPFIGGGACFFTLAAEGRFEHAVINDYNRELTDVYRVVRDFPDELMRDLRDLEDRYPESPKPIFETWRGLAPFDLDPVKRAARMIFLNKTGFNGMYRVNKDGRFNVPWGQKEGRVALFEEDIIRDANHLLNWRATILTGDFEEAIDTAREGDFVYLDPPYAPVSETSDFAGYTDKGFGHEEQLRLHAAFKRLYDKGVYAIQSNSDAPELRKLYEGFEIHEIEAKRSINSKGEGRGPVTEVLIVSRAPPRGISVTP